MWFPISINKECSLSVIELTYLNKDSVDTVNVKLSMLSYILCYWPSTLLHTHTHKEKIKLQKPYMSPLTHNQSYR